MEILASKLISRAENSMVRHYHLPTLWLYCWSPWGGWLSCWPSCSTCSLCRPSCSTCPSCWPSCGTGTLCLPFGGDWLHSSSLPGLLTTSDGEATSATGRVDTPTTGHSLKSNIDGRSRLDDQASKREQEEGKG